MDIPLAGLKAGPVVDRACYTEPAIFDAEMCRIFERGWLFVAHASELPGPGDFQTTELAGQPVIAVRGNNREIRVLFNTCRHRGSLVELDREGKRDSFRCCYHHWEYGLDGRLVNVPREEGYGADFSKDDYPLVPVPRMAVRDGLIFASLDPNAPPFEDYLGPAAEDANEVATYNGRELVVLGRYDFSYNGNWKMLFENTFDDYHAQYLHAGAYQLRGYDYGKSYGSQKKGKNHTRAPTAHGIHSALAWIDDAETLEYQTERLRHLHLGIFPSFLGLYHPGWDVTNYRILRPEAVNRTKVINYVLGPADADEERRKQIAERFHYSYGPGGRVGLDDVRVFEYLQKGLMAKIGGDVLLTRGMEVAGPVGGPADEHPIRAFWSGWRHFMQDDEGQPLVDAAE
jgi:benzoate/toluate 1,2-dioxygenase alpha subunit